MAEHFGNELLAGFEGLILVVAAEECDVLLDKCFAIRSEAICAGGKVSDERGGPLTGGCSPE